MTSDELKAAAERILNRSRLHYECWVQSDNDECALAVELLKRLADDEQQAKEDAEPITEEWLRSLGFGSVGRGILYLHVGHTGLSWSQLGMFYGTTAIDVTTRGQIRKLLEALKGGTR